MPLTLGQARWCCRPGRSTTWPKYLAVPIRPTPMATTSVTNAWYQAWDEISRDRDHFQRWLETEVLAAPDARRPR